MRTIVREQLDDIALGATVLGTGGGGDPYVGKLMAAAALERYGPITLIAPDELADDALVIPVGMMGAPTVMVEKLPEGREAAAVVAGLEAYLGGSAAAVMATEAGGINSTIAFVVAAARGLPLVDADLVGRAFPELQMCTPSLYGTPATPLALADDKENSTVLTAISNRWAERLARSLTIQMGCWGMVALYPLRGRQVEEQCVLGTITRIERIGATLREARADHVDPVEAVRAVTDGYLIWRGKITDVSRRTISGFARGEVTIAGIDAWAGRTLSIGFQNEFLIARDGDEVLTVTPDLISILDAETGEPITTETLRYGFRVVVLAIPGDPHWRSEAGLQVVGPAYFGYDVPFIPVEETAGRALSVAG
ncbi:MAG: DUF917 domain-containing protein [Thermomicrobiales bacterium]|nr:DUF917 domain-containing protein [Thermomicrobiales bacterium]